MTQTIMSVSIAIIAPALLKAQATMGNAVKDAKNPFFKSKYADLNAVREASHPALNENKIFVLQPMVQKEGKTYVRTLLVHESGEFIGSDTEVVTAKPNDPQAAGSAISYARRYGLQALVSLGAEDDDGESNMSRPVFNKKSEPKIEAKEVSTPVVLQKEETTKKVTFKKPRMAEPARENENVVEASNEKLEGWE